MQEIIDFLNQLKDRVTKLEGKRISQDMILPDAIKSRAVGEGVRFIRDGTTANKPTKGETPVMGAASYFDYQTNKLWIWNRSTNAWKFVQLA